jgi:hypothetical protein
MITPPSPVVDADHFRRGNDRHPRVQPSPRRRRGPEIGIPRARLGLSMGSHLKPSSVNAIVTEAFVNDIGSSLQANGLGLANYEPIAFAAS